MVERGRLPVVGLVGWAMGRACSSVGTTGPSQVTAASRSQRHRSSEREGREHCESERSEETETTKRN